MTDSIEFFVHSLAAPSAAEPDASLTEEHWSYMDSFAGGMIARGPTLAADRATWTGSVHIVELPSIEAARQFVEREPYHRAGLFERHVIRRFDNLLGRTMWEFPGESDDPRFLVIAHASAVPLPDLSAFARDRLIVHGRLLTPDAGTPVGLVLALHAPTRQAVHAILSGREALLDEDLDLHVHDWEFGGRR
jgi:uncharacterized protein